MSEVSLEELELVKGGFNTWCGACVSAVVVFICGVIDGFVNPRGCSNE